MTLFVFSETSNSIEEWDLSTIGDPTMSRQYPVYDKLINVTENTYAYSSKNDMFFITAADDQTGTGNYLMVYKGKD